MKIFGRVDDALIFAIQHCYELLLDAFGVKIGSFRLTVVLAFSLFAVVKQIAQIIAYWSIMSPSVLAVSVVIGPVMSCATILMGIRWIGFKIKDQRDDDRAQSQGKFSTVNRRAIIARCEPTARWCFGLIGIVLLPLFGLPPATFLAVGAGSWLMTVMVRDRNHTRFSPKSGLVGAT